MRELEKTGQDDQVSVEHENSPPRQLLVNCFIAAFLLVQILVPLSYYTGDRGNDERFAWRMFSTVRQQLLSQRASSVVVEPADSNGMAWRVTLVDQLVSEPWVEFIEQDQRIVVDRFLEWRCKRGDSGEVRLEVKRWNADGHSLPTVRHSIDCAVREGNLESTP